MSDHVIVWDLETVPDIAGYAAANGLTGKSNEEIQESLGNKFPKHTTLLSTAMAPWKAMCVITNRASQVT